MTKIEQALKNKFINSNGTINKTTVVSVITLVIVLINEILAIFGITPVHQDQAVAIINTILTILGILGFVEPGQESKSGSVTPSVTEHTSTNSVSPSEIKALTSLASQAERMESESIAQVSTSVLASQKSAQNQTKSAK